MSRPLLKSTYYYKLNRRIPNGTYGGVRGKSIHCLGEKFSLLDYYFNKPKPVTTYLPPCRLATAGGLLYNAPLIDNEDE